MALPFKVTITYIRVTENFISSILFLRENMKKAYRIQRLQADFLKLKFGMFLHFNMGTFTSEEWATPGQSPNTFNPKSLDCNQWADAAKAAGMKYMTLTTKHHDGFCLWPSAYNSYNVKFSSWKNGKGDVVREFVNATRLKGLEVCFYYSIWDKTSGEDPAFIKNQLTELLTNYGPIKVMWFDGWGWQVGYQKVPYESIRDHIKSLQPDCLILENNHEKSLAHSDIVGYERNIDGVVLEGNTLPAEMCDNIRSDGKWFYQTEGYDNLKSLEEIIASKNSSNKYSCNYLLDVTPDVRGRIPDCQVELLKKIGATG
jgi:alpha-L-fucosidase